MNEVIDSFRGDYAFLSNFHKTPVEFEGVIYPTVEHAYQAAKSLDPKVRTDFVPLDATEAKALGQVVKARGDWEQIKVTIMRYLLQQKFAIPKYTKKLLDTGESHLKEGNWWHDNFWGECRCENCKAQGPGKNMLGTLLEEVRNQLLKKESGDEKEKLSGSQK